MPFQRFSQIRGSARRGRGFGLIELIIVISIIAILSAMAAPSF
ncbi:prepilin-type N-terminal cleavage/methylation domain-containing protein [Dokdonella sp.]